MMSWSHRLMDWKNVHVLYVHFLPLRVCNGVSEEILEPAQCRRAWTQNQACGHVVRHIRALPCCNWTDCYLIRGLCVRNPLIVKHSLHHISFSLLSIQHICKLLHTYIGSGIEQSLLCIESAMICRCTMDMCVPVCCHCFDHVEDVCSEPLPARDAWATFPPLSHASSTFLCAEPLSLCSPMADFM